MRIDFYTKAVLTVIALCLMWICAKDVVSPPAARAAAGVAAQEVIISGVRIPLRDNSGAPLVDIDGKPMFTGAVPVREAGR